MRARRALLGTVLLVVAASTAACSDPGEDYCEAVAAERDAFTGLAESPDRDGVRQTLDALERLREEAPDELRDEYDTLVNAFAALDDALTETGLDLDDLSAEEPPEGVDRADYDRVAGTAADLVSARVRDAAGGVEQHAADVCGVDFAG